MSYTLQLGPWSAVFAVPGALVDQYIQEADGPALKVILLLLRSGGRSWSARELADASGLTVPEVENALEYWVSNGLLAKDESPLSTTLRPNDLPQPSDGAASRKKEHTAPRLPRPDGLYVTQYLENSPEIRDLLEEVEALLGKTLSPALSSTLIHAHEDYGLPPDVILMLLNYAQKHGKANANYIASTAKGWAEAGILTAEAAEDRLRELDEVHAAWARCETAFGMTSRRAPSRAEGEAARRWLFTWGVSDDLLKEAYDRCVDNTGKFSMRYINAVLERWHNAGIRTVEEASKEPAPKKTAKPESRASTFDLQEYKAYDFFDEDD